MTSAPDHALDPMQVGHTLNRVAAEEYEVGVKRLSGRRTITEADIVLHAATAILALVAGWIYVSSPRSERAAL